MTLLRFTPLPGCMTRRGGCWGGRGRGGRESIAARFTVAAGIGMIALLLLGASALQAQSSSDLRLRGVGVGLLYVDPHDLDGAVGFEARLDLGFLVPHLRVMPRFAFWSADLADSEVRKFETKLEDLVARQNPGQPRPEIDLGNVNQDAVILGGDLQWLPLVDAPVRPYLGIGSEIYILNGSGDAIDGTFIEDRLDVLTAGVSAVAGLEFQVRRNFAVYGDLRGSLVADVRNVAFTAGVAFVQP